MRKPAHLERLAFVFLAGVAIVAAFSYFGKPHGTSLPEVSPQRIAELAMGQPTRPESPASVRMTARSLAMGPSLFDAPDIPDIEEPILFPDILPLERFRDRRTKSVGYFDKTKVTKDRFVAEGAAWLSKKTGARHDLARKIAEDAWKRKHGALLLAMASVESDARPRLKHANNYGLCQVSTVHLDAREIRRVERKGHRTVRDCGVRSASDLFDISRNLCAADAIFDRIFQESGKDPKKALVRYNANKRIKHAYGRKVWSRYSELATRMAKGSDVAAN